MGVACTSLEGRTKKHMSAAIKVVKSLTAQPIPLEIAKSLGPVANPIEMELEQRLAVALDHVVRLQSEVRTLREKLMQAERLVARKEELIRNSMRREQALRIELMERGF